MRTALPWRPWLITVSLCLAAAGCGETPPAGDPTLVPSVNTYEVHGVVVELPDEVAGSKLQIRHEEIPGFVSREGEAVGMKAMVMSFPLGEGVSLDGLTAGDSVKFSFEMTWAPEDSGYQVVAIEPAPDHVPTAETETAHDGHDHAGHDHGSHAGPHDPHGHPHGDHHDHAGTTHEH